jgi:AcrR family transcriptional regulator
MDRPLRRDAQRNRELLVKAARAVFGERGLDAPLEEIARTAGLAIGTLYNRFPTRSALVEAAFDADMVRTAELLDEALAMADPWAGFVHFLEASSAMQAADRGFTELCRRDFPESPGIDAGKARSSAKFAEVVERAKRAGRLRADFRPADLAFIVGSSTGNADWRRHLGFIVDGLRADAAQRR